MELSSERPFDIPMQAMDFVVTVMYEQVLVQGKCVGGTPDAALIHQYVQHRNHVCRLCVKSHTVHCGWILCTDDFPFCTTKSCLVSRVQWGQHGQQLRVRLEIGYLQPGEFEALTADSLEKLQGRKSLNFSTCRQTFDFWHKVILSRAKDFGRVHKLSSGMGKTIGRTVVKKTHKPIFRAVVGRISDHGQFPNIEK